MDKEYVPFNCFSYDMNHPYDAEFHSLSGSFTEETLQTREDTFKVVEYIKREIEQCGEMLLQKPFLLEEYDEDGNIKEEYLDEGEEEHRITLFGFPGIFVNKKLLKLYSRMLPEKIITECAYKGKIPMKLMVKPATFWGDHFRDLAERGIDAKSDNIFGIVDIELLCQTLRAMNINISFTTLVNEEYDKRYRVMHAELDRKYATIFSDNYFKEHQQLVDDLLAMFPDLEFPTADQYLENLIKTKMRSSVTISIPFSQFLKEHKSKSNIMVRAKQKKINDIH